MTTTNSNLLHTTVRLDELWTPRGPVVMGIINCTPDSFSDGGRFLDLDQAIQEAERQIDAGARIIDIGGESTRPGAENVPADEEVRRIVPVIAELRRRHPSMVISADTTKTKVALAALDAGADIINDVSAATDPGMLDVVANGRAAIVLMHRRGTPETMQQNTNYDHTVAEVHAYLRERAAAAMKLGIDPERIWLDPGIGFGKGDSGNLALLAAVPELASLDHPVVVGPSRKSFIGRLTGARVDDRLPGTLASLIPSVGLDRVVVRVHEPEPVVQFLELARLVREAAA